MITASIVFGILPDVRLVDGDGSYRGRLEIRHTGEWGTVCNKNFNNGAASVVCHQLGYTGAYRVQSFRSGPAGGVIWLENVQCNGNEASILECSYDGGGSTSCSHDDDVGIICTGDFVNTNYCLMHFRSYIPNCNMVALKLYNYTICI